MRKKDKGIIHIPVLLKELIAYLKPRPGQSFIDATAGLGGHAKAVLKKIRPTGRFLAIDRDPTAINYLKKTIFDKQFNAYLGNFKNLSEIVKKANFNEVDGIYFDLGLGSWQIEDESYGMSFEREGPLLMKYNKDEALKADARSIVEKWPKEKLTEILRTYGEVKRPHLIAERITNYRRLKPIKTTKDLVLATGVKDKKVLAKIFQAVRIAVNDELQNLKEALPQALEILKRGGRLAIISYHSGEDRIVKNFFRENERKGELKILTKKPIVAKDEEIKNNPRARSAKMRVAEKL